jgi:putative oxidoreductase
VNASADLGLLALRLAVFVIMAFHGTQKLFGWWDGGGLDRAEAFFASQGFRPPRLMALIAGVTECAGAILLGAGALTVLAAAMLTGVLTNVAALHLRNGLDRTKHGFEFELMILAGVVALGLAGPGGWSVDHWLGVPTRAWLGPAAVAIGVVSGLLVTSTRRRTGLPVAPPPRVGAGAVPDAGKPE